MTTRSPTNQNLDAALIAMVQRHDAIFEEWDRLVEGDEDDPRIAALSGESCDIERKIVATPAFTQEGLDAKWRVLTRAELEAFDDLGIIDMILTLDAERVGTAG
ncbi:hypothetical protein [Bradyrhizobium sp.]|uniref:hypothetical protein n=1 Tax=Bradyrhizobium sp. TaxID=376 RepID=UPI003C34CE29